jgi:hypothetical protein
MEHVVDPMLAVKDELLLFSLLLLPLLLLLRAGAWMEHVVDPMLAVKIGLLLLLLLTHYCC